jgi:hypothetical protein
MVDWDKDVTRELPVPANEPPPFMLALGDDWECNPVTLIRHTMPMAQGESD